MTPVPPPPHVTGQPGRAAGIGAVALAVLVAIAVAGLFLVLIGHNPAIGRPRRSTTAPASPEHTERPRNAVVVARPTSARRPHSTTS